MGLNQLYTSNIFSFRFHYMHTPPSATSAGRAVQNDWIKQKLIQSWNMEKQQLWKCSPNSKNAKGGRNTRLKITKCLQTLLFAKTGFS